MTVRESKETVRAMRLNRSEIMRAFVFRQSTIDAINAGQEVFPAEYPKKPIEGSDASDLPTPTNIKP